MSYEQANTIEYTIRPKYHMLSAIYTESTPLPRKVLAKLYAPKWEPLRSGIRDAIAQWIRSKRPMGVSFVRVASAAILRSREPCGSPIIKQKSSRNQAEEAISIDDPIPEKLSIELPVCLWINDSKRRAFSSMHAHQLGQAHGATESDPGAS